LQHKLGCDTSLHGGVLQLSDVGQAWGEAAHFHFYFKQLKTLQLAATVTLSSAGTTILKTVLLPAIVLKRPRFSGKRLSLTLCEAQTENTTMLNRQTLTGTTIACNENFPKSRPYIRSMACITHAVIFAA
jgi:hypothetical protein